jgi:hypothetical protein
MDLSRIPEPMRSRLQAQLEALPPEIRAGLEQKLAKLPANQLEAVLKKTAPMLERLAGKPVARKTSSSTVASKTGSLTGQAPKPQAVFDPHDHYNNTIHRGDRESPPLFVIMFLVACIAVALQAFGLLGS